MCCLLLCLILVVTPTLSARILSIVTTPSYSHQIAYRPLWRQLLQKGHHITLLTTDPMQDPTLTNLTEIDVSISYIKWREMNINDLSKSSVLEAIERMNRFGYEIVEEQLLLPQVQELITSATKSFDLVMIEPIYIAMAAFAEKFDCPLIQVLSVDGSRYMYYLVGNPTHPVLNPEYFFSYSGELSFFQRLTSTLTAELITQVHIFYFAPTQSKLIQKYFGSNYSYVEDILRKTSMLFVNTDLVFNTLRATPPNVVRFGGGVHLIPPKPLRKDLRRQLDNATKGFIYFSLGTNVKGDRLSENIRQVFLDTFAELPYLVLWKFEKEDLPGKPDNVIISKWFPQQDILRHPNIKMFITQGGLQSTEEAIYSHVPLIGIPFIGDQHKNVIVIVNKGMGLHIDHETINKNTLKTTILEVINNPRYRDNVKRLAQLAKDEPMSGLERAVWWTEYVIRHKGAPHLRSPVLDIPFYQYFLLDIVGFCLITPTLLTYMVYKFYKLILRLIKKIVTISKLKKK